MNMSARLMGKADRNTVLCDASTAKEAEDAFSFKEAMRIKVLPTLTAPSGYVGRP